MKVEVNGVERELESGMSVLALVRVLGLLPEQVAVERNRRLVRREQLGSTELCEGDRIEVVTLVGGG